MVCPKCSGSNVQVSMVQDKLKTNHVSPLARMGRLLLILCTCGLWLLVPKSKSNSSIKNRKMAVCQSCGHSWRV